jgi:WD40 repeat protein
LIDDLAALGVTQSPEQWEDDDDRFVGQVRDLIAAIAQPVIIFVDALDQMRPPYRPAWLPNTLKPNVKLIVSVLDDQSYVSERAIVLALRNRLPSEAFVDIEPLSASDGADILNGLEREAGRALKPSQRDFIIDRFLAAGALPLYLVVAFAVARRWRSTDDPSERGLAFGLTSLIAQFIDELSSVHHHEPLLVRRALGLLIAGKDGLSESELIALLSRDEAVMQAISSAQFGAHAARLPDSIWVRLKRNLSAMLAEKGVDGEPLLNFFHRQVGEVARTQFYEAEKVALHRRLADYFDGPANTGGERGGFNRRSLSELPYQLFHAEMRTRLDELLTDPTWIGAKIEAFSGVAEIVEDYERFADPAQKLEPLIGRTLRLASPIIARDPRQAMAQLHGRLIGAAHASDSPFLRALRNQLAENSLVETVPALTPPGAELARLEGHTGKVMALVALPDGRLVSGAADKTIRLWDPGSGLEVSRFIGDDSQYGVIALSLLGDGRLVSGGNDGIVRLWDLAGGREAARLEGHNAPVQAFAVLSDRRLASAAHNGEIRIWDIDSERELRRLGGRNGYAVSALAVLPDGRLVSGGVYGDIRFWDTTTGAELGGLEGHEDDVLALLVLQDGRLASGGSSGAIRLWDLESGREVACLKGHRGNLNALAALPDGRMVSGAQDGIIVWDLQSLQEVARLDSPLGWIRALAVLPDGRLASGTQGGARLDEGSVSLWDLTREFVPIAGHRKAVLSLAVLTEGRLASGGDDGAIVYWDAQSGRELHRVEAGALGIAALALLPDGRLASGEANNNSLIRLWEPQTGRQLDQFIADGAVRALAALPDGRLASCVARTGDEYVLWDLHAANKREASRQLASFKYIGGKALTVLPNGRLAGAGDDGGVRLWDPASGREIAALNGHSARVNALAALPNERLASGSEDSTIRLWDLHSGRQLAQLEGHTGPINAIVALPDGSLASASDDRTIRLWDLAHRRELARLEVDGKVFALAALSRERLVAGDQLGRLHWLAIGGAKESKAATHAPKHQSKRAVARQRKAERGAQPLETADDGAPSRSPMTGGSARWTLGLVFLSAALFVAAAALGPEFGFRAAHDALTQLLAIIPQR